MQEYTFEIKGITPLIMHADNIVEADALEAWRMVPEHKDLSKAGDDRSPAWTWQANIYHDGEHLVIPQENIMRTLRDGGVRMIYKKQKTYKDLTQIGLTIPDQYCRFENNGQRIALADIVAFRAEPFSVHVARCRELGFELFAKRAKIGQSKHIRVRPKFEHWSVSGTIVVTEEAITFDVLKQLFDIAGRFSGLGDWRPSSPKSPGPFGRFNAEVWRAA